MQGNEELKRRVDKILVDVKLPKEIKGIVESIYLDYEEACKACIRNIKRVENKGNTQKITQLAKDVNTLFSDDISTLNMVIENIYQEKYTEIRDRLQQELNYIERMQQKELAPLIFDTEEEEKYYQEHKDEIKIEQLIKNRQSDEEFIKTVQDIMLSEINSSKKDIELEIRSNAIFKEDEEQVFYQKKIQSQFLEDIDRVIIKIKEEIPEIGKILERQEEEIYQRVIEEIQKHKQDKRGKFVSDLYVSVNPQEAVEKVIKENEEKIEDKGMETLPGNVIE